MERIKNKSSSESEKEDKPKGGSELKIMTPNY